MDDAAMIYNPGVWPAWPCLPLKRSAKGALPECAYILDTGVCSIELPIKVFKGNIFRISDDDPVIATYDSVEALLAAGWVVD